MFPKNHTELQCTEGPEASVTARTVNNSGLRNLIFLSTCKMPGRFQHWQEQLQTQHVPAHQDFLHAGREESSAKIPADFKGRSSEISAS